MYHLSQFVACLVFAGLMANHINALPLQPRPKAKMPQPEPLPLCDCGQSNLLATMDGRPRTMCSHQAHRLSGLMQVCHVFEKSYPGELANEVNKLIQEGLVIQSVTPLAARDNKICSIMVISEDLRIPGATHESK